MKKLKIFNKTYIYSFVFEIEYDINVIRELIIKIKEPQILYPDSINPLSIYISRDYHHIADGCIRWIYEQNKERLNEKCLCDCLLKCAVEDKEWTRKVNEDFTEIQRRKLTFLPEIQDAVCDKLNGYLTILETMHTEMMKEKQKEKEEKGITIRKDFKLPPILPIVYYTGTDTWSAEVNFSNSVYLSNEFSKYIPNFSYELVPLNKYTIEDLMKYEDILSFIMILDKIKKDVKNEIKEYIDYYNNYRYQWNLKKMTPVMYRNHLLKESA